MPIFTCPHCNRRFVVNDEHILDYEHKCNSKSEVLDNEDVPKTGNWEDYTGTGSITQYELRYAGTENKLFGTRADIEGEDLEDITSRGKRKSTHRTRQHLHFVKLKNG